MAPYPIVNENRLLTDFPGAVAGKNGYTDDAKKTFVGAVDRDGRRYVIVQMFGLSQAGNTYWDQYRRLLDYGVALRGKSVGTLVTADGAAPGPERGEKDVVVESGPSGMGNGTRLLIGLGGLALIAVLVGAAMRTNRGR